MKLFELNGCVREQLGKKAAKALRAENLIPCELYGQGTNLHFTVKETDLRKLIYTPDVYVIDLTVGEKKCKAIIQETQYHPISDRVLHMDFLEIDEQKPVVMQVPVRLEGLAAGVKAGGKLSLDMRKIKVKALWNTIPERLVINVENLELGKAIQIKNLAFDGMELLNNPGAVVCCVKATRGSRAASEESTEETAE